MSAAARELPAHPVSGAVVPPIVVVGNGPVGMRICAELLQRQPRARVVVYGAEQHRPYNRVRLSSWLAGDIKLQELEQPLPASLLERIEERIGCRVLAIDRAEHCVLDHSGRRQRYDRLVLATGSRARVPSIPGIDTNRVYTLRDLDDVSHLLARRASSHHSVILGGGLLGLEAARGMQRGNTRVTLIEHTDRLLGQQLDEDGSSTLQRSLEQLGIEFIVGDGVAEVLGEDRVQGVRLRGGRELRCDTLVLATGINPNIDLARSARLAYGRGVQVDDRMRTSDPLIYAVGECAEHRGRVYGLVSPGLEQAAVAASDIADLESHYQGSISASRLKVVGTQVFSIGPVGAGEDPFYGRAHVYEDKQRGIYRKILVRRNRLVGAIGIGAWGETPRLQSSVEQQRLVMPWQLLRFQRTGKLWHDNEGGSVAAWPASATVCQCTGVSRGRIGDVISGGASSVAEITERTGAGSVCGTCKPLLAELAGARSQLEPARFSGALSTVALISLLLALAILAAPPIPYPDSVQVGWRWDMLWRDGMIKQVSGFSILGLFAVGLLLSLRKRTKMLSRLGGYDGWRLAHMVLGVLVIGALLAHTGLRLGHGLNFALMLSFALMLLVGAFSSGVIAQEHRIGGALATRLRRQSVWVHILLFWPVPALLGWHVFKSYWF